MLLGILLWIVLSTVAELANPQPLETPATQAEAPQFDSSLPAIAFGGELIEWLGENRMDPAAARKSVSNYRYWMAERGYPIYTYWYSVAAGSLIDLPGPPPENDAELVALAGAGDASAAVKLGSRSIKDDPLAALEWFDQAIVNGSIWAMIRTADLLTSLSDPALDDFPSSPVWEQSMAMIKVQGPPLERALAWYIATVIVGGYPVLDNDLSDRIGELSQRLNKAQINNACELAQSYVLDTAMARRARGGAVFSLERPLFAASVAEPGSVLPCDIPVQPLIDMSDCLKEAFIGPGQRLWQMYFCPSP